MGTTPRGEVRRRAGWTLTTVTIHPPDVNPGSDQKGSHQNKQKEDQSPRRGPFIFSYLQTTGTWLDQTLRTRWENTTHHACEWTGRSVLCNPAVSKVNPKTLQPKHRAMLSLCQRMCDPGPACWFRFTTVGTFPLAHQSDKKGATLPHKQKNHPRWCCQFAV